MEQGAASLEAGRGPVESAARIELDTPRKPNMIDASSSSTNRGPLRCRLETTTSIEGPRASAPHPPSVKIVSIPLRFEEPAPAPLQTLAGLPTLRLADKGARRPRLVLALLHSKASRYTSLVGDSCRSPSGSALRAPFLAEEAGVRAVTSTGGKSVWVGLTRGMRGQVEACSDLVSAAGARGCIVIIIWFAG